MYDPDNEQHLLYLEQHRMRLARSIADPAGKSFNDLARYVLSEVRRAETPACLPTPFQRRF